MKNIVKFALIAASALCLAACQKETPGISEEVKDYLDAQKTLVNVDANAYGKFYSEASYRVNVKLASENVAIAYDGVAFDGFAGRGYALDVDFNSASEELAAGTYTYAANKKYEPGTFNAANTTLTYLSGDEQSYVLAPSSTIDVEVDAESGEYRIVLHADLVSGVETELEFKGEIEFGIADYLCEPLSPIEFTIEAESVELEPLQDYSDYTYYYSLYVGNYGLFPFDYNLNIVGKDGETATFFIENYVYYPDVKWEEFCPSGTYYVEAGSFDTKKGKVSDSHVVLGNHCVLYPVTDEEGYGVLEVEIEVDANGNVTFLDCDFESVLGSTGKITFGSRDK